MKNLRTLLLITILSFGISGVTNAQEPGYRTAIGGKLGSLTGFNVKHYFSNLMAIEGTAGASPGGIGVAALAEFNFHFSAAPYLTLFVGVGADVGASLYDGWGYYRNHPGYRGVNVGVDGTLGLEYTFQNIPLNLSLDFGPRFAVIPGPGFDPLGYSGLAIRYTFK